MFGVSVKVEPLRDKRTGRFVSRAAFKNISHAAASIAKDAKASITRSKTKASPGQPPKTRRGLLKRAIRYAIGPDKKSAVIGPLASIAGESAKAHEFGGRYKGADYPERPFMQPALERAAPRFAGSFAGSIGE